MASATPTPAIAEIVVRHRGRIVDVQHVGWHDCARTRYTIGESRGADLVVALPVDVALVVAHEHGFVLGVPPGARGRLGELDLAAARARGRHLLALSPGARARIELGELEFEVALVAAERPARGQLAIDRLALACHAAAVIVLAGIFLSLETDAPGELGREDAGRLERVARYLEAIPPAAPAMPPGLRQVRAPRVAAQAPTAPRTHATTELTAGDPSAPPASAADAIRRDAAAGMEYPFARYLAPARTEKLSGGTGRSDSGYDFDRVVGILGEDGFRAASDAFVVGMRIGARAYTADAESDAWWAAQTSGPPRPFGGLELTETERGGGVHDEPRSGPASSRQVTLAAAARPLPPPSAEEMVRIRRHVTLEIDPPTLMQDAGIAGADLHRYMRRRSGPLRACYESALDSDAATNGCMQVQIRFDERGVVTRAWVDWGTLDIERISRCLVAEIRGWKVAPVLPKPTMAVIRLDFSARTQ